MLTAMDSPDVVLVHGLYHQPAHFQPLAEALRRRGASVRSPRLHRGSLAADTAAVQRAIDLSVTTPVVVGHSYGGAVISGVNGAGALLYLAAFVPDAGESCAVLGGPDAPVNAWVRPHPRGGTFIPPDVATDLFYADCHPRAAERATSLLVPQASGHGRGVVQRAAWRYVRSHYVGSTEDRAMSPELQRQLARRCTSSQVITAGHSPYISRPDDIADIVLGL
ncbi:alpha/beta hydrolase [Brachybacterium sacelli]